ncbi:hypothetical protein OUZ56_024207 [Daphnia magna]|uniref:Uncharacterized protein n=1 Tax=Daphnia magna TaxID=35525 RepID=A0ABR0B0B5_9CRUS|nr:hypothetical protein OUZ56_024207 [Daphnia magna]
MATLFVAETLGLCRQQNIIDTGKQNQFDNHPCGHGRERIIIEAQCRKWKKAGYRTLEQPGSGSGPGQKEGRDVRFCVDYRRLNAVTISVSAAEDEETLARWKGAAFFLIMDLRSGSGKCPLGKGTVRNGVRPRWAIPIKCTLGRWTNTCRKCAGWDV